MTSGAFRTALNALAALTVPAINNYGVDTVPTTLTRAHLPALLVIPGELTDTLDADNRALTQQKGVGFQAIAFSDGAQNLTVTVTHLFLLASVRNGAGSRSHLPQLIDHIDAYIAALGADVTLGGTLLLPAQVTVEPGIFQHGAVSYYGCAFRHTWVLVV